MWHRLLPEWSVWAGCFVPGAASSPAPGRRCNPLSAARWPPGRDKRTHKNGARANSLMFFAKLLQKQKWNFNHSQNLKKHKQNKNGIFCRTIKCRARSKSVSVFLYLAEFLSVRVGQQGFQGLEACIDALHAPALVAVGNLSADSSLLVLGSLRTEGDVGQAGERRDNRYFVLYDPCSRSGFKYKDRHFSFHIILIVYISTEGRHNSMRNHPSSTNLWNKSATLSRWANKLQQ